MKVIFTGDPIELERGEGLSRLSTTIYGKIFPMNAEVDVSDLSQKQQQKLLNNAHFRLAGVDGPAVPLILPVAAVQAQPEPVAQADEFAPPAPAKSASGAKRKSA